MIILISEVDGEAGATVQEPANCESFHVRTAMDDWTLDRILGAAGLGKVRDGVAFVDPAGVRQLVEEAMTPEWEVSFAAMVAYAATKNWVDDDGLIQAHIER